MDGLQPAVTLVRQPTVAHRGRRLSRAGIVLLAAVFACGQGHAAMMDSATVDSIAGARQDSINRAQPGYVVDSILPVEEQLRRFRAGLPDTLRGFVGGAGSGEELVRQFVDGVQDADTSALLRLTISRAEFAWLIYPDSPFSRRPYQQAPDLVWMQHAVATSTGLQRLLSRFGGKPLVLHSWSCSERFATEGLNRIRKGCTLTFADASSESRTLQLFSSIIERRGRFKILSYDNAF